MNKNAPSNKETIKIKVAQKGFSGKNYLEISCYIEVEEMEGYVLLKDLIFFELSPNFNRHKKLKMKISSIELRALSIAIKECLRKGETEYKKFTDKKLHDGEGNKKNLTVARDTKTLYINFNEDNQTTGYGMDFYSALAFADIIVLMAETTEKAIYHHQHKGTRFTQ